jgi:hypothetical protein
MTWQPSNTIKAREVVELFGQLGVPHFQRGRVWGARLAVTRSISLKLHQHSQAVVEILLLVGEFPLLECSPEFFVSRLNRYLCSRTLQAEPGQLAHRLDDSRFELLPRFVGPVDPGRRDVCDRLAYRFRR